MNCIHTSQLYADTDNVAIQAWVVFHLKSKPNTISTLFPNLLTSHREDILEKLKDKTLHMSMRCTFVFDSTKSVVRLDTEADVFDALMNELGSIDDVAIAMEGTRLQLDGSLRVYEDEHNAESGIASMEE